ncbi:inverse autotransporter beta domain-containing protein [Methylophaga pinxianii]|uniref:inverse autotransporter beta domain-containing protein n=1 Tax=Methylophaga pinxianii TaxID=2881052 RepID=UPI001CF34115|nr:inverse autotransporter beta domain-containing protein [Methylophaga pinxianii]MCB2427688.1 inverse autotransporter beta domain-containing protein [Methylophaga pinxianii]UPH46191.1 inverse autotransporter beta domain-containing protein [Methylophaga pinxianii]
MDAIRSLLWATAVAGLLSHPAITKEAAAEDQSYDSTNNKWESRFELGGRVSDERSLGEGSMFIPLTQTQDSLIFVDLRGMFDDQNAREGNIGLGMRRMLRNGWNLGGYGYFDLRRSSMGNRFYQGVLGGEALSKDIDLRGNLYLPLGNREKRMELPTTTTQVSESFFNPANLAIETQRRTTTTSGLVREKALTGFDIEVGFRIPVFDTASGMDLRAFVGGYYFDASGMEPVRGPRGRLEFTARALNSRLGKLLPGLRFTAGVTVQEDGPRGQQTIGYARLSLPFQRPSRTTRTLNFMERRMTETVVRDVDIVTNNQTEIITSEPIISVETEAAVNSWNGEQITSIVQVDSSDGQSALQSALDDASGGDIVVANGDFIVSGTTELAAGRTLLSGNTVLPLRGADSGVEVGFTTPGSEGSLSGTFGSGDSYMVQMANNSVLGGMNLENNNSSTYGVVLQNADNTIVYDNTIDVARSGIDMRSGDGISILRNSVNSRASGIQAQNGSVTNLTIDGNTVSSRYSSIFVGNGPAAYSARISNNIMSPSGGPQYGTIDILSGPLREVLSGSDGNVYVPGSNTRCALRSNFDGIVSFIDGGSCQ